MPTALKNYFHKNRNMKTVKTTKQNKTKQNTEVNLMACELH